MKKDDLILFTWEQANPVTGQAERFAAACYSRSVLMNLLIASGWKHHSLPDPHMRLVSDLRARAKEEFSKVLGDPDTIYFWTFAMNPYYAKYS